MNISPNAFAAILTEQVDLVRQKAAIEVLRKAGLPHKCPRCGGLPGGPSCGKSIHAEFDDVYNGRNNEALVPLTDEQRQKIEAELPSLKANWPKARREQGYDLEIYAAHNAERILGVKPCEAPEEAEKMIRLYIRQKRKP